MPTPSARRTRRPRDSPGDRHAPAPCPLCGLDLHPPEDDPGLAADFLDHRDALGESVSAEDAMLLAAAWREARAFAGHRCGVAVDDGDDD